MSASLSTNLARTLSIKGCFPACGNVNLHFFLCFLQQHSRRYLCSKSNEGQGQSNMESNVDQRLRETETDSGSSGAPEDLADKPQEDPSVTSAEFPSVQIQSESTPLRRAPRISEALLRRREAQKKITEQETLQYYSPEFFPPMGRRSRLLDYLHRQECFKRRMVIDIPEFYVGSILAVTVADATSPNKSNRFVGICIERKNFGLGASFKLRNTIDGEGIEILYEMYSPRIQKIEVLKLEKHVDPHLLYLRDALPEYSTIDPNMLPIKLLPGKPVPINTTKVILKPRPWARKWEQYELKGIDYSPIQGKYFLQRWETLEEKHWLPDYKKYDLLNMFPKYPLTEREKQGIKKEYEVHLKELEEKKKQVASS